MVSFSCDDCGEIIPKKKLEVHFKRCSACSISCIACGERFYGYEYKYHNECITEEEKVQGPLYRGKKKQNKGAAQGQANSTQLSAQPSPATPPSTPTATPDTRAPVSNGTSNKKRKREESDETAEDDATKRQKLEQPTADTTNGTHPQVHTNGVNGPSSPPSTGKHNIGAASSTPLLAGDINWAQLIAEELKASSKAMKVKQLSKALAERLSERLRCEIKQAVKAEIKNQKKLTDSEAQFEIDGKSVKLKAIRK